MQFRQLGESGLEVSLVGLGANNFGPPKGVMQSHRSLLASLEPMRTAFTLGPRDETLCYGSLAHLSGRLFSLLLHLRWGHS